MKSLQPDGSVLITGPVRPPPNPIGAQSSRACTLVFAVNYIDTPGVKMGATLKDGYTYGYIYRPGFASGGWPEDVAILNSHGSRPDSAATGGEFFNYQVRGTCILKYRVI
jgi:hypothetical protein